MTIVLSEELEARLRAEADRRGSDPETLAIEAIQEKVREPATEYGYLQRTLSPQEWVRQSEEFARSHEPWPDVPDEALTREGIYGDHL